MKPHLIKHHPLCRAERSKVNLKNRPANSFAKVDFLFHGDFYERVQKWRSVFKTDTPSLKPGFRLKKLRILRV
jgi:hypothetical protein